MNIKQQYENILEKEYKFALINEINSLKEQCILENNTEYFFKCTLLISDVYIEHQNFDDALSLLLREIKNLDTVVFKNIYIDFLERLIYLYINKRNYSVALRYISQKEKCVSSDKDSVNRLLLEYSYVYGNMNDLVKAEDYLLKLLDNNPTDELKSVAYSNLTKIYVDLKEVEKAKEFLNECLVYSDGHESEVYNDYLLAKICDLEGKTSDAMQLYESIFVNEEINLMTLPMMNEYLELLNRLKKYNKSLLLMNKLSIFINASSDYIVVHNFFKNKLDYFIGIKDTTNANVTKKEIEQIEKIIQENEQQILSNNIEEDRNDIKERTEEEAFNKVDLLTTLVDTALKGNTLREIIMDFGVKVQKIINFDEFQFVLFNKVDEKEYQISDEINCFKFNNKRLYEKKLSYESLKGSIVELMVNNNKPIVVDFNNFNMDVKDLFSNKIYDREVYKYLNAIPCLYKDDTFACVIYCSKETDLTNHSNSILLKVATKLLESPLIIQFLEDNNKKIECLNNFIIDEYSIGLFQLNNNTLYLSNTLKTLLSFKQNSISIDAYIKKIAKSDVNKYLDHLNCDQKTNIKYKFDVNDKIIELEEVVSPVKDLTGKTLYYQGYIKSLESESVGYALSEKDLLNRLSELKKNTSLIEFKFSLIKIKGLVGEYNEIKNTFGVEPYFLNDGTFIIILENEANQRTIDKLIKDYSKRTSVIRYPRDIVNVDEMLEVASIMMGEEKVYFNNDIYRIFVKRNNLINKLDSITESEMKINALQFKYYDNEVVNLLKPIIFGLDDKDSAYNYLNGINLLQLEHKFVDTLMQLDISEHSLVLVSNELIYKVLTELDEEKIKHIDFIIKEYNQYTNLIIEKAKSLNKKIYIDYSLISKLDAYFFTTGIIKGVFISENVNPDLNKLFKILSMFDLVLMCYNNVYDYDKVCCYNNVKKVMN